VGTGFPKGSCSKQSDEIMIRFNLTGSWSRRRHFTTGGQVLTDPTGESKERNREIAENESARQATGDVRVSVWAIALAAIIGLAAFGWVFVHNN
jgi:hypothetical protein